MALVHAIQESPYELARKQKIKENNEMLKKIFGERNINMCNSPELKTKRVHTNLNSPCAPRPRQSKPSVQLPPRRNPKRTARSYPSKEEDGDREEPDSGSESPNRLLVRWVGPLTKKRRTSFISSDNYEHELSDEPAALSTRKQRVHSPRVIRPVSDFTEEELLLIASSVSEKHKDPEYGTTCHQCRQKTDDLKTICRDESCMGIRGQFCGPCLKNRYGESVKDALLDETWSCPPCRNICNCSFCMPKRGRRCTGQLIGVARQNGYKDVRTFLGD